jgi:hypothetical protein
LLALDFASDVRAVVSQPFRLRFASGEGWPVHIPDFLAVTRGGGLLVDVRPAGRVGADGRVCFAASAEAAVACGWRYLVVTGWRQPALSTVDALSAQRRRLADPLGVGAGVAGCGAGRSGHVRGSGVGPRRCRWWRAGTPFTCCGIGGWGRLWRSR